ncbi:MAG: Uncharacterised protein [Bacteroidetes bacterium MED-G17]|nr:MAG: Uncharacterised protein [Bacteroidetes bacterium MED-G17]|tara:strand:+ start:11839 stop:12201 length:363 start_codon:yes stop_codon:yes gene_type:complete
MAEKMTTQNIQDENDFIPETWVPKAESHGTKDIWQKFWILLGLTLIDIIIYFFPESVLAMPIKAALFIVFGIAKAYYIVGTFMHLKHERVDLIMSILLPIFFIIFFIIWMLQEGNAWFSA